MAQKFRLGMKGKLFHGAGGTTGVPTKELDNVSDVTITLDAAEAEVPLVRIPDFAQRYPVSRNAPSSGP